MMSPGDSDLQLRIVNAFINYFLNSETSVAAIETAHKCLTAIESEYNVPDDFSTLPSMFVFAFSNPFTVFKWHHVRKIRDCKHALEYAGKNTLKNTGVFTVRVLLEFFRKSDNWTVADMLKGPSINMRLTCELLKAAGVKEDCGLFLQKYSVDFMKEVDAALNRIAIPIVVTSTEELVRSYTNSAVIESAPAPITISRDSLFEGSRKHSFYIAADQQNQGQRSTSTSPNSHYNNYSFTMD